MVDTEQRLIAFDIFLIFFYAETLAKSSRQHLTPAAII